MFIVHVFRTSARVQFDRMSVPRAGSGSVTPKSPKCPTCDKSVYFNEQVLALEKAYHKRCLKCAQCSKVLDPGGFSDRGGV